MIIVLKPDSTQEQIDHIVERLTELGLRPEVSKGIKRTLIGVIGEEDVIRNARLLATAISAAVVTLTHRHGGGSRATGPETNTTSCPRRCAARASA